MLINLLSFSMKFSNGHISMQSEFELTNNRKMLHSEMLLNWKFNKLKIMLDYSYLLQYVAWLLPAASWHQMSSLSVSLMLFPQRERKLWVFSLDRFDTCFWAYFMYLFFVYLVESTVCYTVSFSIILVLKTTIMIIQWN